MIDFHMYAFAYMYVHKNRSVSVYFFRNSPQYFGGSTRFQSTVITEFLWCSNLEINIKKGDGVGNTNK